MKKIRLLIVPLTLTPIFPITLLSSCSYIAPSNTISGRDVWIDSPTLEVYVRNDKNFNSYVLTSDTAHLTIETWDSHGTATITWDLNTTITKQNITLSDKNGNELNKWEINIHNDTKTDINSFIEDRSFALRGTKNSINDLSGSMFQTVDGYGTGFIVSRISGYQYLMLTNWHVEVLLKDQVNYQHLYYGFDNSISKTSGFHSFSSWSSVGVGRMNEWAGKAWGTDTYMYDVDFGVNPAAAGANLRTRLDNINTYCEAHNGLATPLAATTTYDKKELFIGGYPCVDESKKRFDYTFVDTRVYEYNGYKDKDWANPVESQTISHFVNTKKNWSIGNEIILDPSSCDPLSGGASGSIAIEVSGNSSNREYSLVGIYFGGWREMETRLYYGGCESLSNAIASGTDAYPENWINYSIKDLYSQLAN